MKFSILYAFMLLPFYMWAQDNTNPPDIEKLHRRHEKWNSCFVIQLNGDTVYGKIKDADDYSYNTIFGNGEITFARVNDEEIKLPINAVKELDVMGKDVLYSKYITTVTKPVPDEGKKGSFYRVIISGKCMLVYKLFVKDGYDFHGGQISKLDRLFLYHNGVLTKTSTDDYIGGNPKFIKNCKVIFSDCPTLLQKIENKTLGPMDLEKIVTEYNACSTDAAK